MLYHAYTFIWKIYIFAFPLTNEKASQSFGIWQVDVLYNKWNFVIQFCLWGSRGQQFYLYNSLAKLHILKQEQFLFYLNVLLYLRYLFCGTFMY